MPDTTVGVPSASQIFKYTDSMATLFKGTYLNDGLGLSTETTTKTALAKQVRAIIMGDGTTTYPGIGLSALQNRVGPALDQQVARARYDTWFNAAKDIVSPLQRQITDWLPATWRFTDNVNLFQIFDSYLLYLNAAHANTPATPGAAGALTATRVSGGGLPTMLAANSPFIVHCLVNSAGDCFVSLPSPEATRVDVTGANNALSYQIAGGIPATVDTVRIFRTRVGGVTGGPYFLDPTPYPVSPGAISYPPLIITTPDSGLRSDWNPPAWMSCPMTPEFADIFALSGASGAGDNPLAFGITGMMTPNNVVLGPSNGFVGEGNPANTAEFGRRIVGTGFTAGNIATVNNYLTNSQGFIGAGGAANIMRARVEGVLNTAGTTSITYTYYVAGGYGSPLSVASAAAAFSGTAIGQTAVYVIPNGRIVVAVTAETPGGGLTGGTYVIEAVFPRTY